MNCLLNKYNVVVNLSSLNEAPLVLRNDPGEDFFYSVSIALVMILYPVLQSKIGQNLEKLWAPFSLGINTRKEELVLPPILLQFWDFLTILTISFWMISQQAM